MKGGKKRSENEREKTKMRERKRRSITTNILRGLRKHGGYRLSHRSDINAVLRQLANEAGFVVEPDGTTYRSKALIKCPLCGAATANLTSIPNSTITTNGSTSTASLAMPAGAVTVAVASDDHHGKNNNVGGFSSPLLCFDGPISVPVYTCQDQVAVESGGGNGGDGFMDQCCSNGNG